MDELQSKGQCDRILICLNFRRDGPTYCTLCGVAITMNHFHDSLRDLRLCDRCFGNNLEALLYGRFVGRTTGPEPCNCENFQNCFATEPFGMYVPKTCNCCGREPLPEHFHDIARNLRLCLQCYARKVLDSPLEP
jgi:hypothetical protein